LVCWRIWRRTSRLASTSAELNCGVLVAFCKADRAICKATLHDPMHCVPMENHHPKRLRLVASSDDAQADLIPLAAAECARLSASLSELARKLAAFSMGDSVAPAAEWQLRSEIDRVRDVIRSRRKRASILPACLFGEPAWDMLLELYLARLRQQRLSVTQVCTAAGVPGTTAARWLSVLVDRGLVTREGDRLDSRRFFVELTDSAAATMAAYFSRTR